MLDVGNILKQFQAEEPWRPFFSDVQIKVTGSPWRGLLLKKDITEEEDQGSRQSIRNKDLNWANAYAFLCFELPNNTQREVV